MLPSADLQRKSVCKLARPPIPAPRGASNTGSGSAEGKTSSHGPLKKRVKYVQPVSASWEQELGEVGFGSLPAVQLTAPIGSSGRSSENTKGNTSSGEGQVQSIRHRIAGAASPNGKRKRVEFKETLAPAAAQLPESLASPPALAVQGLDAQRQLGLLKVPSPFPCLPAACMVPPAGAAPSAMKAMLPMVLSVGSLDPASSLPLSPSALSSLAQSSQGTPAKDVQGKLTDLFDHFVAMRDTQLRQAAAIISNPMQLSAAQGAMTPSSYAAATRAFQKALEIINNSLPLSVQPTKSQQQNGKHTYARLVTCPRMRLVGSSAVYLTPTTGCRTKDLEDGCSGP